VFVIVMTTLTTSWLRDVGSDDTFAAVRGSSEGVQSNNNAGSSGVYVAQQLQQQQRDAVNNVSARPNRQTDGGVYRPSSYGPRGPPTKTGLHFVIAVIYRYSCCCLIQSAS